MFLVDDFGRQRMRPEDLLNRWIVPLESRVDYLTLHTGKKFQVPFDVLIVFATNLDPLSLADEAFLRRIPYKIPIEDPTVEQFTRDLRAELQAAQPALPPGDGRVPAAPALRARSAGRCASCHPRDLLDQVIGALPLPRRRSRSSRASCSTRRAAPTSSTSELKRPEPRGAMRRAAAPTGTGIHSSGSTSDDRAQRSIGVRRRGHSSACCSCCCRSTSSATSCGPDTLTAVLLLLERVAGRRSDDLQAPAQMVDRSLAGRAW